MSSHYGRPKTAGSLGQSSHRPSNKISQMPDISLSSHRLIQSTKPQTLPQTSETHFTNRRQLQKSISENESIVQKVRKTKSASPSKRKIKCLKAEVLKANKATNQLMQQLEEVIADNQKLREENASLRGKCEQSEREIAQLKRHVCPSRTSEDGNRTVDVVMRELWAHLIRKHKDAREFKESLCAKVQEQRGVCSHQSLQSGLQQFGFYLSHTEALNLVRQIAGLDKPSEEQCISVDAFRARFRKSQPFPLEEDVTGSLRCLSVLFSLHQVTPQLLKTRLDSHLTLDKLKRKLASFCQELESKKFHTVCEFLLRGEQQDQGSAVCERLLRALPPWKPFSELTQCKDRILTVLETNDGLRNALHEFIPSMDRNTFRRLWEKFRESLSSYEELFIVVASTKHALKHIVKYGFADPLVQITKRVLVKKLLDWTYKDDIQPSEPTPAQHLEDSDDL